MFDTKHIVAHCSWELFATNCILLVSHTLNLSHRKEYFRWKVIKQENRNKKSNKKEYLNEKLKILDALMLDVL